MADPTVRWLRGDVVGRRRVLEDRLLRIDGQRIGWLGRPADDAAGARAAQPVDGLVAPAFVDVHCHGGGGIDVHGPGVEALASGGRDAVEATVEALLAFAAHEASRGVAAVLPTAVTIPLPALRTWLAAVAEATAIQAGEAARARRDTAARARRGTAAGGSTGGRTAAPSGAAILGANLEGPALAAARRGAHPEADLIAPAALLEEFRAHRGLWSPVRVVTVAPEGAGGLELVRALAEEGIVVCVGHTTADAATARAAYDAGARSTTHLFNAMAPLHHRAPGPIGVVLDDDRVFAELIADGVHVDPMLFRPLVRALGDRLLLVSDAIPAAGVGDGELLVGSLRVVVRGREARLADGTLAGSVTPLDGGVAQAVAAGVSLPSAVAAASTVPARLLGIRDRGMLRRGARADLVVLGEDGTVRRVLIGGHELGG